MRTVVIALCLVATARADTPPAKQLTTSKIGDGLHLIAGPGGNIALMTGKDAAFLVDDQIAPITPELRATIAAITAQPVRFIINTHWHPDHTGGNEVLGGAGALIIAQENVRRRLAAGQFSALKQKQIPPAAAVALPVVTFNEGVTLHFNGDDIEAIHVAPAHTDGDSLVYYHNHDVLHMGDTYFNGMYPFIDLQSGGSFDGMIAAAERGLAIAHEQTVIIPGHGPAGTRITLQAYRDMLIAVRDKIRALIRAKKTLDEVQAAKPTAAYDAQWGGGFMKPALFVDIAYKSLSSK